MSRVSPQHGAILLNAVLLLTLFALLTGAMAHLLTTGLEGFGEHVLASRAFHVARGAASLWDGLLCSVPPDPVTLDGLGEATFSRTDLGAANWTLRVTGRALDGHGARRILERRVSCVDGAFQNLSPWREVVE